MEKNQLFNKYRARLVREGIIFSVLWGVLVGFALMFVVAFISWLCGFDGGMWLSIGLGVGAGVSCAVILYFVKFKPSDLDVARRVDALGLEERMVTMLEFEKDDSYLARRQREDAKEKLHRADYKKITIQLSASFIVALAIVPLAGVGMITVEALAENDVVPSFPALVAPAERTHFITVEYRVDGDGEIDGEEVQILERGELATPVKAVAAEGWEFERWDDQLKNPYRDDGEISESAIYTAIFREIEDRDDEEGDGEAPGDSDGEGDRDGGQRGEPGTANGAGEGQEGGNSGEGEGEGEGGEEGEGEGEGKGGGAGYHYDPANQIENGETYYRDVIEKYRRDLEEKLASGEELTPEERAIIELYFGTL